MSTTSGPAPSRACERSSTIKGLHLFIDHSDLLSQGIFLIVDLIAVKKRRLGPSQGPGLHDVWSFVSRLARLSDPHGFGGLLDLVAPRR
jgi:hypothetical protein